ncbi:hypothetical protein [Streptomyces sp. RerS4]|uniref:hypothetical protein n=1 Tax=Streptomyces sp. RerS4 TaxID=2942449 RepID=UPI00201BADE2|nr:hypothetical protein [Streptomyces sp. RerS4]UQX02379.1 hypothetical protein M4D82_19220 [Streptomyces sp. RerS4]
MIRNAFGALLGLIGATAAVWSPFRAWYDGRRGRDYRVEELFSGAGITAESAALFGSLLLPCVFAALLTLAAIVLRSRLLMGLAGIVVLGFAVLWMVRQGQAAGGMSVGDDGRGLGDGVAAAFAGGALLLLAAAVMRGRRRAPRDRDRDRDRDLPDRDRAPDRDYGGPDTTGPDTPQPPHRPASPDEPWPPAPPPRE